jgi:hypothetical protein
VSIFALALVLGKLNSEASPERLQPFISIGNLQFAIARNAASEGRNGSRAIWPGKDGVCWMHHSFPQTRDTDVSFTAQTEPGSSIDNLLWPATA